MASAGNLDGHAADRVDRGGRLGPGGIGWAYAVRPYSRLAAQLDDLGHDAEGDLFGFDGAEVEASGGFDPLDRSGRQASSTQLVAQRCAPPRAGDKRDVGKVDLECLLQHLLVVLTEAG